MILGITVDEYWLGWALRKQLRILKIIEHIRRFDFGWTLLLDGDTWCGGHTIKTKSILKNEWNEQIIIGCAGCLVRGPHTTGARSTNGYKSEKTERGWVVILWCSVRNTGNRRFIVLSPLWPVREQAKWRDRYLYFEIYLYAEFSLAKFTNIVVMANLALSSVRKTWVHADWREASAELSSAMGKIKVIPPPNRIVHMATDFQWKSSTKIYRKLSHYEDLLVDKIFVIAKKINCRRVQGVRWGASGGVRVETKEEDDQGVL